MTAEETSLLEQVAFLNKRKGGIPIAVSLPQVKPGVWQASAEIGCSHPGVMRRGPERNTPGKAHTDRAGFIEEQLAGPGPLAGGSVEYVPVDGLPPCG